MALRGGPGSRAVLCSQPEVRGQVISECEVLHSHLPLAQVRKLGSFIYDSLSR
jgi:hypothetical protein